MVYYIVTYFVEKFIDNFHSEAFHNLNHEIKIFLSLHFYIEQFENILLSSRDKCSVCQFCPYRRNKFIFGNSQTIEQKILPNMVYYLWYVT